MLTNAAEFIRKLGSGNSIIVLYDSVFISLRTKLSACFLAWSKIQMCKINFLNIEYIEYESYIKVVMLYEIIIHS